MTNCIVLLGVGDTVACWKYLRPGALGVISHELFVSGRDDIVWRGITFFYRIDGQAVFGRAFDNLACS